ELGEFGGERARRSGVGAVGGIGLEAPVAGIRDHVARFAEQALDLVPSGVGVDTGADAAHLDAAVHHGTAGKALEENRVRLAGRKRCQALAAVWVLRRLHHDDGAGLVRRHGLAGEQVGVRLQKAAGAKLKDRERGHGQISMMALITPAPGVIQKGKRSGACSSVARWVTRASVGTSPSRMARNTSWKSSGVAFRLASSVVSRL